MLSNGLVAPLVGQDSNYELYRTLSRSSPTAIGRLFDIIDWPGLQLREALSGRPGATGRQLVNSFGLSTGNGWIDAPVGLAAEMALDPTNLLTMGAGAAGKAAKAARAAGILDDAARAYSRQLIRTGGVDDLMAASGWARPVSRVTRGAADVFERAGFTGADEAVDWAKITDSDLAARPLVGQSTALRGKLPSTGRQMTLGDLVNAQADSAKAAENVRNYAATKGLDYDSLLKDVLYKDIGIGSLATNIPGGEWLAGASDLVGQGLKHSMLGRKAYQLFDNNVRGSYDDVEQLMARRLSAADKAGSAQAASRVSELLNQVDPGILKLSRAGSNGRILRALIEGPGAMAALDPALLAQPEVKAFLAESLAPQRQKLVDVTRKFFADYLDDSAEAGIKSSKYTDPFGNEYMPRVLDRQLYPDMNKAGVGGNPASVLTGDMQPRSMEFAVPGGTNTLTDLSGQEFLRSKSLSDRDMAGKVMEFIGEKERQLADAGLPAEEAYTKSNAMKLARKLRAMDSSALESGRRLFAQHPVELIDRYATGRQRAMARASELQDMLAQVAEPGKPRDMPGGDYMGLRQAARHLGMSTTHSIDEAGELTVRGAEKNIVERLERFGLDVDDDTLKEMSVSPELRRRLENIARFYADDRTKTAFGEAVGAVTAHFKQWVLAIPRRFARDWYSGLFSNFVTNPNPVDLVYGYGITKHVMQQDWDRAAAQLQSLPRYAGLSPQQIIRKVQGEMAEVNMAQTGKLHDAGLESLLGTDAAQTFARYQGGTDRPVTTPAYAAWDAIMGNSDAPSLFSSAYAGSELATKKGWLSDLLPTTAASRPVTNPILRASARAAETTDEINRLGGYFSLLKGGYSPEAAAAAVTRAQIDYGSLTPFERSFLSGGLFPFWSYLSRISVWGSKELLTNPAYRNAAIRTPLTLSGNREGGYVPTRIEERYGFRIPDEYRKFAEPLLGSNVKGNTFLSDIDLPFVDSILMIDPVVDPDSGRLDVLGTAQNSLQSLASQANPLLKTAFEGISGRDLYTKTDLDVTRRTMPTLLRRAGLRDAGAQETVGTLEPLAMAVAPWLNYPLSVARRVTSEKNTPLQGAVQAGVNLLSGVKVETVGMEEELRDVRERIGRFLKTSPYARTMSMTFIPEDQQEFAPDKLQQLIELDKQLSKQQRLIRQQRLRGNPLLTY